ncbi:Tol-Pal system protein TolB [Malaciobacter mytili]|uniref:Translocation protein TolB n=1 Tax=Malaciobacter mytili LMG 24559 TaxID=1032238 RepID=A0AAX2AKS8_9BACT|nr:Tol-Pal system protein TolB [Malaciobacter mytili]AXH15596.1 Tol-Pal system translocation protein TolB [Malaciobacter mytili LMG 24559]RXK16216.1 translocation protein TolB [Malaciobacter mytili LMG 24559]
MKKFIVLILCFFNFLFAVDARLEIVKEANSLPKIAVSIASNNKDLNFVSKVKSVIENDLKVSGHFEVISTNVLTSFNDRPNLVTLKNQGIDLYLNVDSQISGFGGFILNTKLYDVNSKNLVLDKTFSTKYENRYPFLAHRIAISVNDYLKAPSISWMDKFVIFSVYKDSKKADIIIGDYTLTYQQKIVSGGLNIFPKWANKKQDSFYYTTYNNNIPTLIKTNIYTGKKEILMKSEGMLVASDVSADESKLLITASPNGHADIYLFDLRTKTKQRLTTYKGIDVGGHFVENDKKVVFVSDRLGYPNIFAKTIGNRGVQRLVYHGKNNSSATTYKNYVVYSSRDAINEFGERTFNLYLISTKSDYLRRLTTAGLNQFPKFSSDGESILHLKTFKNKSYIGVIRLNYNKSFTFPLKNGKIQSIDW